MTEESADSDENDAILAMRMDAMLQSSPASFLSIIGAIFAVYVYWSPAVAIPLLAWAACIVAVAVTNILSTAFYARRMPARWTARSWARFQSVMHLLSGLAWGIGGGWMLSLADEHQALVTIAMGLAAITLSITSVIYLRAYQLFHLPIFWCYAIGALFSSLQFSWLIAAGFFFLGFFAALIARGLGEQLSNALRLSIENKRLAQRLEERTAALELANRELEIESQTDPLTGVANRRRLMSFARTVRGRCAMMIVDIDHFKSYNDTFGHVDGDACLVAVAETLAGSVRTRQDIVARLGGEEFAVFVTDISAKEAYALAEAIRAVIETLHVSCAGRVRRQVTVSIGLSTRGPDRHESLATLIEKADASAYQAKSTGRNRVCVAGGAQSRQVA